MEEAINDFLLTHGDKAIDSLMQVKATSVSLNKQKTVMQVIATSYQSCYLRCCLYFKL